jgi:hypothetical protein
MDVVTPVSTKLIHVVNKRKTLFVDPNSNSAMMSLALGKDRCGFRNGENCGACPLTVGRQSFDDITYGNGYTMQQQH